MLLRRKTRTGVCRLGVVVTRKTGTAVTRNRWKRTIRELFRLNRNLLLPCADHVIIVRNTTRGCPLPEDRDEILGLLERAGKA